MKPQKPWLNGAKIENLNDFVPEGKHDISQARSVWNHEENGPVPAGRLNHRTDAADLGSGVWTFSIRGPKWPK
jgi:hypothetical protein